MAPRREMSARRTVVLSLTCVALAVSGLAGATPPGTSGADAFFLVRIGSPIAQRHVDASRVAGLRPVGVEPGSGLIVWGPHASARRLSATEGVGWVGPVPASRKLHPSLAHASVEGLDVTVGPDAVQAVAGSVAGEAVIEGTARHRGLGHLRLRPRPGLPLDAVAASLAARPDVLFVAPSPGEPELLDEATDQILAGNLSADRRRPVPGYRGWLAGMGLSGEGSIVAVADSGIQDLHPDLAGKVVARFDHTQVEGGADLFGHGTFVAGVIAGDPPFAVRPADLDGFVYGQGVAPGAKLVDQAFGYVTGETLPGGGGMTGLVSEAWASGARIQNNSWGLGPKHAGYTQLARETDQVVRDADPQASGAQEMSVIFAAGNTGQGGIKQPQEAKNIISVGATRSGRLLGRPEVVLDQDIDAVADFSTRGPTTDGRVYPTVVAPGARVVSARAPESSEMTWNSLCVTPPDGALLYHTCNGTSFAAPHVAGAAALIHEWWARSHGGRLPSPAMVKASLVNGATDMGAKDVPNRNEGWGRVNLSETLTDGPALRLDQAVTLGSPGEAWTEIVSVQDGEPLRVTLAWTDAPALPGAVPALVNDLDLVVEQLSPAGAPVATWRGNVFEKGVSTQGGAADRLNNIENVWLDAPEPGLYRVRVHGASIPGDGVPGGDDTDQDFALVVRGGTDAPPEGGGDRVASGRGSMAVVVEGYARGGDAFRDRSVLSGSPGA